MNFVLTIYFLMMLFTLSLYLTALKNSFAQIDEMIFICFFVHFNLLFHLKLLYYFFKFSLNYFLFLNTLMISNFFHCMRHFHFIRLNHHPFFFDRNKLKNINSYLFGIIGKHFLYSKDKFMIGIVFCFESFHRDSIL